MHYLHAPNTQSPCRLTKGKQKALRDKTWEENFVHDVIEENEWKKRVYMSKASLVAFSEEVCIYIEHETTGWSPKKDGAHVL